MDHKQLIRKLAASTPEKIAAAALSLFGLIAGAVTVVAVVESYSNQVSFALAHQLYAWHGRIAPVAVDSFIVMGELLLFAAILLRWKGKGLYAFAVLLVTGGFAMSVAANIWSAASATFTDRAIQAIWPVTASAALAGCLIIIKRVMAGRGTGKTAVPATAAKTPPSASSSRTRESASGAVPGRAARTAGLTAASDRERDVVRELVTRGKPVLSISKIEAEFSLPRRASHRAQRLALAQMNGAGHDRAGT